MDAVETRELSKRFGRFPAVDSLTLRVPEGVIFGVLGPNGAGKSTLLRMLTTVVRPSGGFASVAGHDVLRSPASVRRSVGFVPQGRTSDPDLTASENLCFYAGLFGTPLRKQRARAERLLAEVDLVDWRDKLVSTFSGGMRRRLEVACGLVQSPRVLVLDEPASGLDPASRRALRGTLRRLRDTQGLTILLATHDMPEAEALCDEVAILHAGRLVAQAPPHRLVAQLERQPATLEDVYLHHTGQA